ncbi:MAG: ribonuclease HII [Candidatus Jorgensenbacteria bacterium]
MQKTVKSGDIREMGKTATVGIDEVGRAAPKWRASPVSLVGIDEVGRGPLAGPVTVAAVTASARFWRSAKRVGVPLRDSKQLSARQRETWLRHMRTEAARGTVRYALASVYPKTIDRVNITQAANLAATRAFARLAVRHKLSLAHTRVLLDGGLYLRESALFRLGYGRTPKTIVKGDERFPPIMLASIVAKVTRDRAMVRLHRRFPVYGFDEHKGYGTKRHIRAIKKHGSSEAHRLTFIGFLKDRKPKAQRFL